MSLRHSQRELEAVRAAQPSASAQPVVGKVVLRGGYRLLVLWALLIVMFFVIWKVLARGP